MCLLRPTFSASAWFDQCSVSAVCLNRLLFHVGLDQMYILCLDHSLHLLHCARCLIDKHTAEPGYPTGNSLAPRINTASNPHGLQYGILPLSCYLLLRRITRIKNTTIDNVVSQHLTNRYRNQSGLRLLLVSIRMMT